MIGKWTSNPSRMVEIARDIARIYSVEVVKESGWIPADFFVGFMYALYVPENTCPETLSDMGDALAGELAMTDIDFSSHHVFFTREKS